MPPVKSEQIDSQELPPPLHPFVRMAPAPLCNIYSRYARIYMESYQQCLQLLNLIQSKKITLDAARSIMEIRIRQAKKKAVCPTDAVYLNRLKRKKSV